MNELLASFVTEARDLLAEAGGDLLALERSPDDEAAINRLFRSVHTLKGSSGLFDVAPLTRVLHAAEDLFQAIREHRLALRPEMVDLVLKALDLTALWIDHLETHEALPSDAEPTGQRLASTLRACFANPDATALAPEARPERDPGAAADLDAWFGSGTRARLAALGAPLRLVTYEPEESCFFKGEDPLHLALQIPGLAAFAARPRKPWPELRELDPFSCNLRFHAVSTAGQEVLEALFRYVPEQVTIAGLALDAQPGGIASEGVRSAWIKTSGGASGSQARERKPGAAGSGARDGEDRQAAIAWGLLAAQVELLEAPGPAAGFHGRASAAARVACNALRFCGRGQDAAPIEAGLAAARAAGAAAPLLDAIGIALARLRADLGPGAGTSPGLPSEQASPRATGEGGAARDGGAASEAAPASVERGAPRTLRIDQDKIDAMMNLVGELIVAKNSLPFLARRAEHQHGQRELGREIQDQYGVIDRIAQELQGAVMAVRMMPMGQVFQRFPRLVRDLARKLGKQVDLVIEGEATEADKNVIETLFDPLLHMVRNSLDHGVETPAERVRAGKAETATVRLLARHDADQVVIEISDDGRGIDPERMRRKAYERGLIDEDRLARIGDDEARMLVFAAGFSTAERVSDVSGRGVGMDVVRNAVERAGGRIALASETGRGTTVRLHLPLSMAVSRVMTVTLQDRLFGIPMDLIRETVRVRRSDIVRIRSSEAFVLRDRVVPLLRLSRLLEIEDGPDENDEVAVLVVRVREQTVGLAVSAFGEGMEVILKPLAGMLAKVGGYAGTALLGDGRVLLVLDLKTLVG